MLVRIVGVGVDEADGDGFHALRQEGRCRLANRRLIQRRDDAAVGSDALRRLQPPAPRHQRLRLAPGQVEHAGRANAADLQHVAEAARGQQPGPRADLLQDGVRRHRGAVHDLGDLARIEPRLRQHRRNAGRDALARIDGRGRCLVHVDAPVGQREDNVREGAANIHADTRSAAHVRTPMVRIFASTMAPINLLTSEMDVSQD